MQKKMHSLLSRQLKKCFGDLFLVPSEWQAFVDAVDAAYQESDADRTMLERALDLSSQELLQANSEMRAIFQTIPDLLFRFGHDGEILDCKAGSTTDLYLPAEKLIGKRIQDVPPEEVGKKFWESIRQVHATKAMASFEYSLTMQGQGCFYEARLLPLVEGQIIAIVRNITGRKQAEEALKESEEKYRTLVENINVGIYRCSPDFLGHFLQANSAMVKIFGYASVGEFLGVSIVDLYQDLEDHRLFLQEIVQQGSVKNKEILMKKRDGTSIVVSCTGKLEYDAQGDKKWIEGVMEDITERKELAEEILKTSKLESLGILAGGIAHDFNNILTAIIGNISLARMLAEPESEVYNRLIESEKASRRAQDLTQQLLTFSKGGAPIKKVCSLADLLRDSANFVLSGSNVRCIFSIAEDLSAVEIDVGQISQVINNLVINAQQAMPRGGTIGVEAENVVVGGPAGEHGLPLPDGNYVKISIRDQGKGIPEEHLDKIFDPYFTTKERGSGLGLTTSYSIMKRHGGHITVKSKVSVGTTFCCYLPASEKRTALAQRGPQEPPQGEGWILIMDDEEIVREVGGSILRYLGYDVDFAHDGREAIEMVKKSLEHGWRYDAIIMDLTIPGGMGGKETIRLLREIDPAVKVIASSGYSNDPIMAEYEKFGFSAIVPKPYEIEYLRKTLHQVIAGDKNSVAHPSSG